MYEQGLDGRKDFFLRVFSFWSFWEIGWVHCGGVFGRGEIGEVRSIRGIKSGEGVDLFGESEEAEDFSEDFVGFAEGDVAGVVVDDVVDVDEDVDEEVVELVEVDEFEDVGVDEGNIISAIVNACRRIDGTRVGCFVCWFILLTEKCRVSSCKAE